MARIRTQEEKDAARQETKERQKQDWAARQDSFPAGQLSEPGNLKNCKEQKRKKAEDRAYRNMQQSPGEESAEVPP